MPQDSPSLADWLAAERSEFDPTPPGYWELVAHVMQSVADAIYDEDMPVAR